MLNITICSADGVCSPRSGACTSSSPGSPISFTASHQTIAQAKGNGGGPAAGKQTSSQAFSEAFANGFTGTPCAGNGTHGLICAP
jgi:hypothetical protein